MRGGMGLRVRLLLYLSSPTGGEPALSLLNGFAF